MKNDFKRKWNCRCCKSKKLTKYLDLGNQSLANSYHKGEDLATFPLEVMFCNDCYHSQLSIVVNPPLLFKNYLYVSGTTEMFRKHCKDLAKDAVGRIKGKINVLDIACNDGTQLEFFRELGCNVQGVDPAENLRKITKSKKIPVVVDYWNEKIAKSLEEKFDLIMGTNVFAHVDNLDEFLNAVKISLKDEGILILEFPYAWQMITHNEFDTVYHEHLSYFTVNSFKSLMDRMGLVIIDVIQTPIHGGSIRFFISKTGKKHSMKVFALIKEERRNKLLSKSSYKKFSKTIKANKKKFVHLLGRLKKENAKIIGYGASAKGNTMLNYFKINLEYIIDDNPLKWGFLTPGRNILIVDPKKIINESRDLCIVILSWNFYNEIVKKISKMRKTKHDRYILYVPGVKITQP